MAPAAQNAAVTIERRTLEEQFTAVAYGDVGRDGLAGWLPDALAAVAAYLQKWGAGPVGDPYLQFVDGEVVAGYVATTPVGGEGDIEPSELPEGEVAVLVAEAGDADAAYESLQAWVAEQGGAPAGDGWEVLVAGDVDGKREVHLPFTA